MVQLAGVVRPAHGRAVDPPVAVRPACLLAAEPPPALPHPAEHQLEPQLPPTILAHRIRRPQIDLPAGLDVLVGVDLAVD